MPFLYATNGEQIRFHDVRREHNRSRWVAGFHTPQALSEMLTRDLDAEFAALDELSQNPQGRPSQAEANAEIEDTIRAGKRKMLVTMATGTGKTLMWLRTTERQGARGPLKRASAAYDRRAA